jgi:hypothetical protein
VLYAEKFANEIGESIDKMLKEYCQDEKPNLHNVAGITALAAGRHTMDILEKLKEIENKYNKLKELYKKETGKEFDGGNEDD